MMLVGVDGLDWSGPPVGSVGGELGDVIGCWVVLGVAVEDGLEG